MVWRPEITAGGCIFLKFLRLTPKRGEGKQRKTIIDRVGGGGHTPKAVAVPTCSSQWPSHWQATVAVPSGRASGRPPTRNPPTCLNTLFLYYYYYYYSYCCYIIMVIMQQCRVSLQPPLEIVVSSLSKQVMSLVTTSTTARRGAATSLELAERRRGSIISMRFLLCTARRT